ncbi:MAG TPA: hypothetical protein DDY37_06985 [Legionella sp.]|nr:hypothetical protein [Legionella sp.]
MTTAKQVMMEISALDKERQRQQAAVDKHKQYWFALFQNHRLVFVAALGAAFFIGWNGPRLLRGDKGFKILGTLLPLMVNLSQLRQAFLVKKPRD